jgi:hypothetical protein
MLPLESPATTVASQSTSSEVMLTEAPLFVAKKYNKRRIQRQNSVGDINHRTKRINRKNGIGSLPTEMEVNRG